MIKFRYKLHPFEIICCVDEILLNLIKLINQLIAGSLDKGINDTFLLFLHEGLPGKIRKKNT